MNRQFRTVALAAASLGLLLSLFLALRPGGDDEKAAGLQYFGSGSISCQFRRFGVRHAVDFDDEFSIQSHEIDDVSVDRMLAAEFPPLQTPIAQRLPEFGLGARL